MNPPGLVKFDDASPDDIVKVIKNSLTKSCLLDPWPTFLVKDCVDTIDHDKLLDCLRKWFGVRGRCLDWFKSYLFDRTQCIKIGSVWCSSRFSSWSFSFLLCTTPLSKVISKHPDVKFHFSADDTQLFIHLTHKNAKIAFDRLGKCLKDVKLWLCANKLKLNADKTDFIIFGSKSQQEKLNPFFPVNILGESVIPSQPFRIWVSGLTQTFPSPKVLKMYVNFVSSR